MLFIVFIITSFIARVVKFLVSVKAFIDVHMVCEEIIGEIMCRKKKNFKKPIKILFQREVYGALLKKEGGKKYVSLALGNTLY